MRPHLPTLIRIVAIVTCFTLFLPWIRIVSTPWFGEPTTSVLGWLEIVRNLLESGNLFALVPFLVYSLMPFYLISAFRPMRDIFVVPLVALLLLEIGGAAQEDSVSYTFLRLFNPSEESLGIGMGLHLVGTIVASALCFLYGSQNTESDLQEEE